MEKFGTNQLFSLLLEVNNGVIICYGTSTVNSTITLPLAYTQNFACAISHAYGDNVSMRTVINNLSSISFSARVNNFPMYYICIGF